MSILAVTLWIPLEIPFHTPLALRVNLPLPSQTHIAPLLLLSHTVLVLCCVVYLLDCSLCLIICFGLSTIQNLTIGFGCVKLAAWKFALGGFLSFSLTSVSSTPQNRQCTSEFPDSC